MNDSAQKISREHATAQENWDAYLRLRDNGHKDYVERARKHNAYYIGDQWEEGTLNELKGSNRPAQTINLILSTVNAVLGEQISSRQEITFKPAGGGANGETARALSLVFKQIEHNNMSRWVETQVCADGLIEERGFVDIRIDFSDNVFGEVRETALDPRDVMIDAAAKEYDPDTWSEVIVTRWMTVDEIEVLYGKEKAEKLRYLSDSQSYGIDSIEFDTETFAQDQNRNAFSQMADSYTYPDEFRRVRRARVLERQWRKLAQCHYFVDPVNGDMRKVPDHWDKGRVAEFAQRMGLFVHKKVERRVRWTTTCDHVELHDEWSPYNRFSVVPFFPYFRRGRPIGLVSNLIGPQDTINKVVSQELHVVNTSANSGWVFQSGSLVNMTATQLMQVGAKTGLVLEYAKGFDPPTKIQPNQVPSGLDRISEKTGRFFREISGVSDAMLGQPGREISGVALESKRRGGLTQLEVVFDNLARSRYFRGRLILDLVQKFYSEERLVRVTERNIHGEEQTEEMQVNQPTAAGEILNDLTLGEYDVVITSSNLRDNDDETTFAQLIQLRQEAGVMIPDWAILEASSLRNKAELVQYAKQMAGAAEPTEEELEMQQLQQQMAMEMAMATLEELKAKAQERMANVQLLVAKAQATNSEIPLELEKLQLDAQQEQARLQNEWIGKQAELQARMIIAQAKSQQQMQQTNMNALVNRLSTEAKERTDTVNMAVTASSKRQELDTQERIAELNARMKAKQAASKPKAAQKKK